MKFLLAIFILLLLNSCKSSKNKLLFDLVEDSGIEFNNVVKDGEIENSFYFRNFYNGGGVALGDINNDGLSDVVLTSNMGENKIYLNKGDFKFDDITSSSGFRQDSMWSTGVVMADINADGWLDIYICNSGHMKDGNRRNKLYINNQNNSFTERSKEYGLDISGYSTQASFFDYDMDGDLDCFLINNSPMPISTLGYTNKRDLPDAEWNVADFLKGGGDHLFRNDNGVFKEVSKEAGIHGTLMSFGLGVSVGDVNNDGYYDVYVANDSYERDYLYINQKNGTFKDELEACMEHNSFSSMGADISDINNDGYQDIFTTDMLPADDYRLKTLGAFDNIDLYNTRIKIGFYHQFMKNCLMVNNKNGQFLETANFSGVSATDWSWGALFFDADNDGLNDIFVCNGVNRDVTNLDFMDFFANDVVQKMVISGEKQNVDSVLQHIPVNPVINSVFRNKGNLQFTDVAKDWGFGQPSFSNGAAYADLDNDGDLDLIVNNENQKAFIYRNNSREHNKNSYISVQLKGKAPNNFAIGSKIKIYKNNEVFSRELIPSRGFQSSMDYRQVIGLGQLKEVDSMIITWPDQRNTKFNSPALNILYKIEQPADAPFQKNDSLNSVSTLFESVISNMDEHSEDDYIDYYYERNVPELLSREGPHIAKADVNGDGLDDVYVCGAKDQPGQLYIQNASGKFIKKIQEVFNTYAGFEDVAVLFFDADKDKDQDLFIGAGGNNSRAGSRELQHRLYFNDGKGNFEIDTRAFPNNDMNIAVAAAHDFDNDGDQDLFVGSRSVPYQYGISPQSYLYQNNGSGQFTDITPPAISKTGMITGATWVDVFGDHNKELVVTGQWMTTKVFVFNNNRFEEHKTTGLEKMHGWWQSIYASDLNGDGKQDLVIGNIGENFYLKPDQKNPVKLWVNDFDQDGNMEQFLTRTVSGKDMPVFLKREIIDQFPALKKENLRHSDYASKSIQDLFPKQLLDKSSILSFNYCSSVVALNNGQGGFTIQALPLMVQLSSVNAISVSDINNDNKPDLVLGGNMFGFPPQFGRLNASYGHVLFNDGKGNFNWVDPKNSGLFLKGQIKDIKEIRSTNSKSFLITQNNEAPVILQLKK